MCSGYGFLIRIDTQILKNSLRRYIQKRTSQSTRSTAAPWRKGAYAAPRRLKKFRPRCVLKLFTIKSSTTWLRQ